MQDYNPGGKQFYHIMYCFFLLFSTHSFLAQDDKQKLDITIYITKEDGKSNCFFLPVFVLDSW